MRLILFFPFLVWGLSSYAQSTEDQLNQAKERRAQIQKRSEDFKKLQQTLGAVDSDLERSHADQKKQADYVRRYTFMYSSGPSDCSSETLYKQFKQYLDFNIGSDFLEIPVDRNSLASSFIFDEQQTADPSVEPSHFLIYRNLAKSKELCSVTLSQNITFRCPDSGVALQMTRKEQHKVYEGCMRGEIKLVEAPRPWYRLW